MLTDTYSAGYDGYSEATVTAPKKPTKPVPETHPPLSPREHAIVELAWKGKGIKDIQRAASKLDPAVPAQKLTLDDHFPQLTPAQKRLIQLAWHGKTTKEIASELGLSENTIRNHLAEIMRRLGVRNRTEVAAMAGKKGLIETFQEAYNAGLSECNGESVSEGKKKAPESIEIQGTLERTNTISEIYSEGYFVDRKEVGKLIVEEAGKTVAIHNVFGPATLTRAGKIGVAALGVGLIGALAYKAIPVIASVFSQLGAMDKQKRAKEAQSGFLYAENNIKQVAALPIPDDVMTAWFNKLLDDEKSLMQGFGGGWNSFARSFNAWIETPAGKDWNKKQAAMSQKGMA